MRFFLFLYNSKYKLITIHLKFRNIIKYRHFVIQDIKNNYKLIKKMIYNNNNIF